TCHGCRCNTRCGLTCRRTLQNWARFGVSVLNHAGKVRMTWARAGKWCATARFHGLDVFWIFHVQLFCGHDHGPLWPLSVTNHDGDWAAQGISMPNASEQSKFISFKLHACTAAIAKATTSKLE